MVYTCELKQLPAQPVLFTRTRTPVENLPQELGKAYDAILKYLAGLSEAPSGPPYACYYNMDMQDLDVEIGFPVAQKLPGNDEIQADEIPAGLYAACEYTGPYSEIGPEAYDPLNHFVTDQGYTPTGVAYEYYLNDPSETPQEELKTRIVFPLQEGKA
jgi:effector-binding domain-containing protein